MGKNGTKNILFVSRSQYGYLIDYYEYCQNLCHAHNIHYLCFDRGLEYYASNKVRVNYYKLKGNKVTKFFGFLLFISNYTRKHPFDIIIVDYFPFCFVLNTFIYIKKIVLDIRTGPIKKKNFIRTIYLLLMKFDSCFFQERSVIDFNLYKTLANLNKWDHIHFFLPLGAHDKRKLRMEKQILPRKCDIRMIYIGTFNYRELYHTIEGLSEYIKKNNSKNYSIKYKIVGTGDSDEYNKIVGIINRYELEHIVYLMGFIKHDNLDSILRWGNIGVSYIPQKKMYDFQPPTKTFEYIFAHLPTIATATHVHRSMFSADYGVLIDDNAQSFCIGLDYIINHFDLNKGISVPDYFISNNTWDGIVNNKFRRILD